MSIYEKSETEDVPFGLDSNVDAAMSHDVVIHSRRTGHRLPLHHRTSTYISLPNVVSVYSPNILKAVMERQLPQDWWGELLSKVKGAGTETRAVSRRGLRHHEFTLHQLVCKEVSLQETIRNVG